MYLSLLRKPRAFLAGHSNTTHSRELVRKKTIDSSWNDSRNLSRMPQFALKYYCHRIRVLHPVFYSNGQLNLHWPCKAMSWPALKSCSGGSISMMGCSRKGKYNSSVTECQTQHSNFPGDSATQVNDSVDPLEIMKYLGNIIIPGAMVAKRSAYTYLELTHLFQKVFSQTNVCNIVIKISTFKWVDFWGKIFLLLGSL